MTVEQHTELIQRIGSNLSDEAAVRQVLAELSEDYAATITASNAAAAKAAELEEKNKALVEFNCNMFKKVGAPMPTEPKEDEKAPKLTYEALFDEKGRLRK